MAGLGCRAALALALAVALLVLAVGGCRGEGSGSTAGDATPEVFGDTEPGPDSADAGPGDDSADAASGPVDALPPPDLVDAASAPDVGDAAPGPDILDAAPGPDILDVASGPDAVDVAPGPDVVDVAPAPDAVDVAPAPDAVDVAPGPDVVDVSPAPDVVDVAPAPDLVDVSPAPDVFRCGGDEDCDDGVGCTVDRCDLATGACAHLPDDAACDDGDLCDGREVCAAAAGGCVEGAPVDCDDGDVCDGVETCDPATGECLAGEAPDCADTDPCSADACDPAGGCVHPADDLAACDDGDPCTDGDHCQGGGCAWTAYVCPEALCEDGRDEDFDGTTDCDDADCAGVPGCLRPEVCDGLDNDGDGVVDNGLPRSEWYPDRDGDGLGLGLPASCASLLAGGATEDGVYEVWPEGGEGGALRVWCDLTRDGGGWTRVFHHDVADGFFASDADAAERSGDDPLSGRYSILSWLESFRSADGTFTLRIEWPDTTTPGRNIWAQESNPTTAPVVGYAAIAVDYTTQYWGGLELSTRTETYLDGSVGHGNWFYSIGSQVVWNGGLPAAQTAAERVSLWVRPGGAAAGGAGAVLACAPPPGFVPVPGDCDDTDGAVFPGADERCDGADDNCDGTADEGCPFGAAALSSLPQPLHFYPRDRATDRCTFAVEGELEGVATAVRVLVTRDDAPYLEITSEDALFSIPVSIEAGLHLYDVAVAWDDGPGWWRPVAAADDVVCGDVFLINGQSNAVAADYHSEYLADQEIDPFVRSFGSAVRDATVADDRRFGVAVAEEAGTHAFIGQWGLRLARAVKDAQGVPVLVINGAVGGTAVSQHQRNDAAPEDLATIYGRLLWRARQAGVAEAVRAILWHQGEADGPRAYEDYLARWTALYDDWLQDYPNVEGIYPFQVRAGCGSPTWNRNVHRDLPGLLPRVLGHMSTTGVAGHDGCHFHHATYVEWGERLARLVNRDLYGTPQPGNVEAPDPVEARWLSETELAIDFGATGGGLTLQPGAEAFFHLSDGATVVAATVVGATVVLTTAAPSAATWVSFVDTEGDIPWLVNDLGIGSFAWYELAITSL